MENKRHEPKNLPSHFPKSKKEESEFGKGKEDVLVCSKCGAFYCKKSWHHSLNIKKENSEKEIGIKGDTICPACIMIRDHQFEGEVIIENIREELMAGVIGTIENSGKEGYNNDPEDRIIEIEKGNNRLRITTTENQLAIRIAKKVKESFNGEIDIKYSDGESVARAKVTLK